jgi:MscS family membrane protein
MPDWLGDSLATALLTAGPFGLTWWQWTFAIGLTAVAVITGVAGGWLLRKALCALTGRTSTYWDNAIVTRLQRPMTIACTIAAISLFVPMLALDAGSAAAVYRLTRVAFGAVVFWGVWRMVDIVRQITAASRWATAVPASRSLIPLGARVTKVAVAAMALVVILSTLGYPVTSLIAGLGIGGLACALAAQKTVENLFGAFSIGVDQPFREGDFVKVDDFVGTVEVIGLRSTRFRTLDRTIISLPNGRLADMRLESFATRDRLRLAMILGLAYGTTRGQMRAVLAGLERTLREHPKIWPDAVVVRFSAFSTSSLDIEIMAWFQTSDWGEFQLIRQNVLLDFMAVVEEAGAEFALPARSVRLADATGLSPFFQRAANDGITASSGNGR